MTQVIQPNNLLSMNGDRLGFQPNIRQVLGDFLNNADKMEWCIGIYINFKESKSKKIHYSGYYP